MVLVSRPRTRKDRPELAAHQPEPRMSTRIFTLSVLLSFERSHINREAVLHISLEQSLVGFVDLPDRDDFDIGGDVVFAAKVEHLLGFGNTADGRAGEAAASENKSEDRDGERLLRRTDQRDVAVAAEELNVGVDVVIGGNRIEDEVEAAGVLLHFIDVARDDDFIGPKAARVFLLAR